MTKRNVAFIAVRILALWFFAQALLDVARVVAFLIQFALRGGGLDAMSPSVLLSFGPVTLVPAFVGILLWWKSRSLASRVAGLQDDTAQEPKADSRIDGATITSIGLCLIGAYVGLHALQSLVSNLIYALTSKPEGVISPAAPSLGDMVAPLVQLAVSLWLIFGSRGIVKFLGRFRTFGVMAAEDDTPAPDPTDSESK
jgi:hypothetical protein